MAEKSLENPAEDKNGNPFKVFCLVSSLKGVSPLPARSFSHLNPFVFSPAPDIPPGVETIKLDGSVTSPQR